MLHKPIITYANRKTLKRYMSHEILCSKMLKFSLLHVTVGGMSRPSKAVTQAKKVAPPAVPDVFRHSGSSFGSAGYASSEDSCFLSGSGSGGTADDGSYGMPSGKSPGPIFTHSGFAFPPMIGKYAHAEDQGAYELYDVINNKRIIY